LKKTGDVPNSSEVFILLPCILLSPKGVLSEWILFFMARSFVCVAFDDWLNSLVYLFIQTGYLPYRIVLKINVRLFLLFIDLFLWPFGFIHSGFFKYRRFYWLVSPCVAPDIFLVVWFKNSILACSLSTVVRRCFIFITFWSFHFLFVFGGTIIFTIDLRQLLFQ